MPALGVRPSLAHFKWALKACQNAWEKAGTLSREEGDAVVRGAAAAVPLMFHLIRENDITPDGDCYSSAIR